MSTKQPTDDTDKKPAVIGLMKEQMDAAEKKSPGAAQLPIAIKVKALDHACGDIPLQATPGAAAYDLHAAIPEPMYIENLIPCLIPTGLVMEIPQGYCGLILPRSGLATKRNISLANTPGLIDSDYRGEIFVALKLNQDWRKLGIHAEINPGDRIAQLLILPVPQVEFIPVLEVSTTERADGGFGSTDKKESSK